MKARRRDDPYRSPSALPDWRARAGSSGRIPDRLVVAWAEYQHGNLCRARKVLDEVRGPASAKGGPPRFKVQAFILDHLLRTREGVGAALDGLEALSGKDLDAKLAAQAHALLERGRDGLPAGERAQAFGALAARAERAGSPMQPHLRLCRLRSLVEAGDLAAARDEAGALMGPRPPRTGVAAGAAVVARIARVLAGDGCGLEGLPLSTLNPMEAIQARCLLAEAHLRMGHPDQALELALEVERANSVFRDGMVGARMRLIRAWVARLRGLPDEAHSQLDAGDRWGTEAGPYLLRSTLLRARLAADQGDLAGARTRLVEVLPALVRRQDAVAIGEASLLELELDLQSRTLRPTDAELGARHAEACRSQDVTDRWRMGCLIARAAPGAPVVETILADAAARASRDPRARALAGLIQASRAALAGQPKEALRIASRLESPPRDDTPDLDLGRWRGQFEVESPAAIPSWSSASGPLQLRTGARLARALVPPDRDQRWLLTLPGREVPIDRYDLPRLVRSRARTDLFVDLPAGEVYARGQRLGLDGQRRLLEVLAYLIRHPGRPIPVEELVSRVWERRLVPFETERNVFTAISRLRKQLPDRTWLATEPDGYRLEPGLSTLLLTRAPPPAP